MLNSSSVVEGLNAFEPAHGPSQSMFQTEAVSQGEHTTLLTSTEVAKRLQVSIDTVARLVARRLLPVYRVARCVRFRSSDIEAFLNLNRTDSRPTHSYGCS